MSVILQVERAALLAVGLTPAGPVFRAFVRLGARIDTSAKRKLSNDMVHVRTGNLRSSQQPPTLVPAAGRLVMTLTNTASYAAAVHNGSRAHQVRPVRRQVLTGWQYEGAPVFTPVANIPAQPARPWLRDAAAESLATMT